jgi:hypothetical protein
MSKQYSTWQEAFVDTKAHAKSNTHQITEIKKSLQGVNKKLDQTSISVNSIKAVVVDDGLVTAIKQQAADLAAIRRDFADYQINRLATCPVAHTNRERRNWTATVIKIIISSIGLLSTAVVVIQFLRGLF